MSRPMFRSGDRVRVALTFTNNGAAPAAGVQSRQPDPEGLVFDDTADAVDFGVSTDGGKTFGPLASLTVPVQGAAAPRDAADLPMSSGCGPSDRAGPKPSVRFLAEFGDPLNDDLLR